MRTALIRSEPPNTSEPPLRRRLRGAGGAPRGSARAPPPADGGESLAGGAEEAQAALDTTYWMLHRGHPGWRRCPPTGALRAAGAAPPALFAAGIAASTTPARRVRTASTDASRRGATRSAGFRLLNDLLNAPATADGG